AQKGQGAVRGQKAMRSHGAVPGRRAVRQHRRLAWHVAVLATHHLAGSPWRSHAIARGRALLPGVELVLAAEPVLAGDCLDQAHLVAGAAEVSAGEDRRAQPRTMRTPLMGRGVEDEVAVTAAIMEADRGVTDQAAESCLGQSLSWIDPG